MSNEINDLKKYVESHGGIHAVRGGGAANRSWNGIRYKTGLRQSRLGPLPMPIFTMALR